MSRAGRHLLFPTDDGTDRRAPSTIIDACKGLVRWQYMLGVGWLAMGAANWWSMQLQWKLEVVMAPLYGEPANQFKGPWTITWDVVAALLPLMLASVSLRCAGALKKFVRSGLMADLHPALKRLRAVWRIMALTILAAFALFLLAVVLATMAYMRHRQQ